MALVAIVERDPAIVTSEALRVAGVVGHADEPLPLRLEQLLARWPVERVAIAASVPFRGMQAMVEDYCSLLAAAIAQRLWRLSH